MKSNKVLKVIACVEIIILYSVIIFALILIGIHKNVIDLSKFEAQATSTLIGSEAYVTASDHNNEIASANPAVTATSSFNGSGTGTGYSSTGTTSGNMNFSGFKSAKISCSAYGSKFGASIKSTKYTTSDGRTGSFSDGSVIDISGATSLYVSMVTSSYTTDNVNYFWNGSITV